MTNIHVRLSNINACEEMVKFIDQLEASPSGIFQSRKFHLKNRSESGEISLKDIILKTQTLATGSNKTLPPELIFGIRLLDEWGNSTLQRISNVFSRILVAIATFFHRLFGNTFQGFDKTKALQEITQKTFLTLITDNELVEQNTLSASLDVVQLEMGNCEFTAEQILYYIQFAAAYHSLPFCREKTTIYEDIIKLMATTLEPSLVIQNAFPNEWRAIQSIRKIHTESSITQYKSPNNLVNANKLIAIINCINKQPLLIKKMALNELYKLANHLNPPEPRKFVAPEYELALNRLKDFPLIFCALAMCNLRSFILKQFIRKDSETVINGKQFLELINAFIIVGRKNEAFFHFMNVHHWELLGNNNLTLIPYTETISHSKNLISVHHAEMYDKLKKAFEKEIDEERRKLLMPQTNEADAKLSASTDYSTTSSPVISSSDLPAPSAPPNEADDEA